MSELLRSLPSLLVKALVIGAVSILLLVLIGQVEDLVTERVATRHTAAARVADSWGGGQATAGVLLAIPVETARGDDEAAMSVARARGQVDRNVLYVLPDSLRVDVDASTERRRVGLYETPVYLAKLAIQGEFDNRDFAHLREQRPGREVKWQDARLIILNSEARAMRAVDDFEVAGASATVSSDAYAGSAAVSTPVPAAALQERGTIPFKVTLQVAGTGRLALLPLARRADLTMRSSWPHPRFEGAPAPLQSSITPDGFTAKWSVLEINRDFGQSWYDDSVRPGRSAVAALSASAVGVGFFEPVDVYHRNYRAVHYAALLIAITFLTFLLWEQLAGIAIHGVQYLMVGLALAMFYLLLLALSEHLSFDAAYGISAGALVALITVYLTGVLPRLSLALGAGAGLAALYAMLYWILRSEDYSLLMGAVLLFGMLAVLMVATRRVDWSRVGRRREAQLE